MTCSASALRFSGRSSVTVTTAPSRRTSTAPPPVPDPDVATVDGLLMRASVRSIAVADSIRAMAERHWNGEGDLVHDEHPVRPVLGRAAEEIAPGILTFVSVASVNAIDTGDGLVML